MQVPDIQDAQIDAESGPQEPEQAEAGQPLEQEQVGPNFISAARDAVANVLQLPFTQAADVPAGEGQEATPKPIDEAAQQKQSASRERKMHTTDDKDKRLSDRDTSDGGKMVYKARSSSGRSDGGTQGAHRMPSNQDQPFVCDEGEGTNAELDIDAMVRKEIAWLKADGYLAGQASFFQACLQG